MGQGQEFHARKMITECMASGGWVLLQNVHLSLSFCSEIIDILVETEHIDDSFRLWVTTEVHEEFPIGLLQMAIKFTNEPPQGIRASMKRSYQVTQMRTAIEETFLCYLICQKKTLDTRNCRKWLLSAPKKLILFSLRICAINEV